MYAKDNNCKWYCYTVNSVHQHIIQYYSVLIIHLLPVATLLNLAHEVRWVAMSLLRKRRTVDWNLNFHFHRN